MNLMMERNAQWSFCWGVFRSSSLFLLGTLFTPQSMATMIYGDAAQTIDAEAWAAGFIGASMLTIYGIFINGRWRWSPVLRVTGYSFLTVMFAFLGYSSFQSAQGVAIWAFTFGFFLPMSVWYLLINIKDAIRRLKSHERLG